MPSGRRSRRQPATEKARAPATPRQHNGAALGAGATHHDSLEGQPLARTAPSIPEPPLAPATGVHDKNVISQSLSCHLAPIESRPAFDVKEPVGAPVRRPENP